MLNIGIADFSEPTLLLLGDVESLSWLADQIEAGKEMNFAKISGVALQLNFQFHLLFTVQGGGLNREGTSFVWHMTPMEGRQLSNKIRGLVHSITPAHAYLDPKPNLAGVEIVASIGEYDPKKVFQS